MITASITNVGGQGVLFQNVAVQAAQWNHTLNAIGEGYIEIPACDAKNFSVVHPWVHELHIQVDGSEVFVGPVRYVEIPTNDTGVARIVAFDMAGWFLVRNANYDMDYTGLGQNVDDILRDLIANSVGVSDPNLLPFVDVQDCPVPHERVVASGENVWEDHITPMLGRLYNMTVFGRGIIFWCADQDCLRQIPPAQSHQFAQAPSLVRDGDIFATEVIATNTEDNISASAGGVHPDWPILVQRNVIDDTYKDLDSLQAAANNLVRSFAPYSTLLADELLAVFGCDDEPWDYSKIAPGYCFQYGSCLGVQDMMITTVQGSLTDGVEQLAIGFQQAD